MVGYHPQVIKDRGTDSEKYKVLKKWRTLCRKAKEFYGRKCALCGSGRNLVCHHKHHPERPEDDCIENLTILCDRCHRAYHRGLSKRGKSHASKYRETISECDRTARDPQR